MEAETSKKQIKEKLMNERKYWRQRVAKLEAKMKEQKEHSDEALEQVLKAYHNLSSMIIRTYGTQLENGDYELKIPVPEGGWLTAGKRDGKEYILVAKEIK